MELAEGESSKSRGNAGAGTGLPLHPPGKRPPAKPVGPFLQRESVLHDCWLLATRHWFALDPSVLIPDLAHIMVSHHSSSEYGALQLCSKMFDLPAFFFLMCIHPGPCMIFSSENSFVALSVNK